MINRRDFIKLGGLASLGLTIQPYNLLSASTHSEHFFLHIFVVGGMDSSYLFDARPLEMTKKNLIQNYLGADPQKWEGTNGQSTWATALVNPLKEFRNDFSVVNGLLMAPNFDGHPQNLNYFMTGNPFGGENYLPHLNNNALPMDTVVSKTNGFGTLLTLDSTNGGSMVQLDYDNLKALIEKIQGSGQLNLQDPLWAYIASRYKAIASESGGSFSRGTSLLNSSLPASAGLESLLQGVQLPTWEDKTTRFLPVLGELFRKKITNTAILTPDLPNPDCHDALSARSHSKIIESAIGIFVQTLKYLKATPFDRNRSLFDVTTVMMSSEFSRTMRQIVNPIDATGTDHNNLTNSVLIGGKGIKGGLVLGASDFASADETLSKTHLRMDQTKVKTMARPFDFSTFTPRTDLPESYKSQDYCHIHSVVNTIYELFGVSKSRYRAPERDSPTSPILKPLLS